MNLVKVYDSEGKHVESYIKPQAKRYYFNGKALTENFRQRILKAKGYHTSRGTVK